MSVPTFIVGTGRCGSTMLSNMLREHSKVLSLSEFWASVTDGMMTSESTAAAFTLEPVDGRRFWSILAAVTPFANLCLRRHVPIPEYLYPVTSSRARYTLRTGVPAILLMTLPHLTDEHDALFDALQAEVNGWPEARVDQQYKRLFDWLAGHFGKLSWIERSAGTLLIADRLMAAFPDARIVHMVRDGRDVARSMQQHAGFRLGMAILALGGYLGVDPITSTDRTRIDDVPDALRQFLPEHLDAGALQDFDVPLDQCGDFWSQHIDKGMAMLGALPPGRLLTLRYEDFFVDPEVQLDTLAAFLGQEFVDRDWSGKCAATVRKPASGWRDLPDKEAQALTDACRPGFDLLRGIGVHYDV